MNRLQFQEINKDGTAVSVSFQYKEGITAVFVSAEREREKPYFGRQPYLDKDEGVSYRIGGFKEMRMLAVYQHKDWWIRPAFVQAAVEVPERTQLLLAEKEDGYLVFLAVCGEQCRTDLSGMEGALQVKVSSNQNNRNHMSGLSLIIAEGRDPYQCCSDAVSYALELLGRPQMKRERRTYPEMLEYFGWCSWDAFYHKVNERGIWEKAKELKEKNIPARWFLIDDGWLDADYKEQLLRGLDAEREKFPEGLGGCVRKLKEEYGIREVGVWHAVMGYWNGLESGSEAAKILQEGSRKLPDGRTVVDADAGKAFLFYDRWHAYLRERCGIDFVKVDGQSAVSLFYSGMESYGAASAAVQKGLNASAALHFNNNIINCMGMASEDMWNRPSSAVSRSSDDFVPEVPHGFCEHALQNAYNNLLQGQFFWGDWDMFWSSHEENRQNSMLRAISGGPVYVSDPVGKTDERYIRPLIYEDGRIIRCDEVGVPTLDCLFENPNESSRPLKIFNRKKDCTVIAAFPVNQELGQCEGSIRTTDVPGLAGRSYQVYSWNEKKLYSLEDGLEIPFVLKGNDAALFLLIPAHGESRALGLLDKYIGTDAVLYEKTEDDKMTVLLREGGEVGLWSKKLVIKVVCGGKEVPFEKKGDLYLAKTEEKDAVMAEFFFA